MPLFRLTPPRREMLLTSHWSDPVHPDAGDLSLSVEEAHLAGLTPERGVRVRPRGALPDEGIARLEGLGLRRCPAAYAQLLDLSACRTPDQYATSALSSRARQKRARAMRAFAGAGGAVRVSRLDDLGASHLGSLYSELLLPFYMSRSINPYWTGLTPKFLEFFAAQAAMHIGDAFLIELVAGDQVLGCLLGRLGNGAEYFAEVAQARTAGSSTDLDLRWERQIGADEMVFDVVLVAEHVAPHAPPDVIAELPRLLWWHAIAWAIEHECSVFSGGVDIVDTPFLRDEYLNVIVAKQQFGMTTATFWAADAPFWRPNPDAFFLARSSAMYAFLDAGAPRLEFIVAGSPLARSAALAMSDRHVSSRRIHVMTRRDAVKMEQQCADAGVPAEVLVWHAPGA